MFSEALRMMDSNIERYMVNELQKDVEELKETLSQKEILIETQADEIAILQEKLKKYEKQ